MRNRIVAGFAAALALVLAFVGATVASADEDMSMRGMGHGSDTKAQIVAENADSGSSHSYNANDRGAVIQHNIVSASDQEAPLEPLAVDCSKSKLEPHAGFQDGNRCVNTAFGEVGLADNNPTLLITKAPRKVKSGKGFTLKVSTRNLLRDRFLGAAAGGYYLETSLLTDDTLLQRGHFHTACRVLTLGTRVAPEPDVVPQFFLATEDGKGSGEADQVRIEVPGKNAAGEPLFKRGDTVQCAAWAGDGSHRIPMMQRANETPAFDAVRIRIK